MFKPLIVASLAAAMAAVPAVAQDAKPADKAPAAAKPAEKETLGIGDKAPDLTAVKWLGDKQVTGFEAGKVYVIDMWATWCGPCVHSIPVINALQQKYKDKGVTIAGVAVWPRKGMKPTKDFYEAQGDKMGYTVGEDVDGKIAKSYMAAAGQHGIPTAFLIGKDGKIAWIGHPEGGLAEALDLVVNDKFDAKAFAKTQAEKEALGEELQAAMQADDFKKVQQLVEKAIKLDPNQVQFQMLRYIATVKVDGKDKAAGIGKDLIAGPLAKDSEGLNALAWMIVDPSGEQMKPEERDADLAIAAASKAAELTKNADPAVLDTLARAYFTKGDAAKAVEIQTKAVELAPEQMKEDLTSSLEEYKTAAKKKS